MRLSGEHVLVTESILYRWLISQPNYREQFTKNWQYAYERMESPDPRETDELIVDSTEPEENLEDAE